MEEKHYKRKWEFIDIMIILVLTATIGLGIWMLIGSPTEMQAIVTLAMFIGTSGLFMLKKIHSIDKNTAVKFKKVKGSFLSVRHDIEKLNININNRLNLMENKINNKLDKLIKK